ncbi:MAG: formimidoylglutamase [Bacteroidales bacterium]|nr:formimidoylglutamase [Bacteroidales bacterium]
MEPEIYFNPINSDLTDLQEAKNQNVGSVIRAHTEKGNFPDLEGAQIALMGVEEDRRGLENQGCAAAPDLVRSFLYKLYSHWSSLSIVDLGNIKSGHTVEDTYFAVKDVISYLLKNNILPILIGGSQDLTYANYLAYENTGKVVNIASVDSVFDLGHEDDELNSRSYLSRIIMHQPNYLFNYTNIGYQTYFVNLDALQLMKNLFFDINRLGNVRANMAETEPMVRNADILSFDISSIRASDAPGSFYAGANGLAGEEACQICRYAGMSDKLTSIGFYEMNPKFDPHGQTAHLVAQMIWYFLDGYANRHQDFPERNNKDFVRFRVFLEDHGEELFFLKSKKTDRWWIQIPPKDESETNINPNHFVPCSYEDYQTAMRQEIPDRWWKLQQKLM